jgi:hypothetical protein
MSLPFSGSKNKSPTFTLVSCLAYSSTLKREATCSSGTLIEFQRTTRRHIPEGVSLPFGMAYTQNLRKTVDKAELKFAILLETSMSLCQRIKTSTTAKRESASVAQMIRIPK